MSRYDRQIRCSEFGQDAQNRLEDATLFIVGAGALGSTICEELTRCGAGKIVICDMDVVEMSNLHRQSCYTESDAQQNILKVHALKAHLSSVNSTVDIIPIHEEITGLNIVHYLEIYRPSIVIDGTDNFNTRFMLNQACHKMNIPWIYGACLGSKGTVYGIDFTGPCLSCLFNNQPKTGEDCSIAGILPPVAHISASLQVAEVMNYIKNGTFSGKLITFDTSTMQFQNKDLTKFKHPDCSVCTHHEYPALSQPLQQITRLCGGKFMLRYPANVFEETKLNFLKSSPYFKYYADDKYQISLFHDGRVIIKGSETKEHALTLLKQLEKAADKSQ